jgi:hypothetical protein
MRKQVCQTWDPFLGYPRRRLTRMTQAPWRIVVHRQAAKPNQIRCYAQETLLDGESFKGSNFLPGQCKAALSHSHCCLVFYSPGYTCALAIIAKVLSFINPHLLFIYLQCERRGLQNIQWWEKGERSSELCG